MNDNNHRVTEQLHRILKTCRAVGFSTLMLVLLLVLGPIMEAKYFPVMENMTGTFTKSEGQRMYFQVYGNKLRNCKFIEVKALVDKSITDDAPPVKAAVWFVNAGEGPTTRPTGYQDLGVWGFIPKGDRVYVEGSWSCHPFWETHQNMGAWDQPHVEINVKD